MRLQLPKVIRSQCLAVVAALAAVLAPPAGAQAQGVDAAYVNGRLALLQRSISDLSARLEQLKAQDQQLQQQMERLRANLGQRLDRLEAGGKPAPRPAPARR